jgi:hypothetical protein
MRVLVLVAGMVGVLAGCGLMVPQTSGVGVGAVVVPTSNAVAPEPAVAPTLTIDSRTVPRDGDTVGFVYRSSIMLHDWRTTANIWRWYGDPPDSVREDGAEALWYAMLFPVLFLAPLAGTDIAGQPGLVVRPGAASGRALPYVEVGPSFSIWLRPSYPELAVDLTAGGWVGVGFEPADRWDLALRTTAAAPVFHARAGSVFAPILSTAFVVSRRSLTLAERRAKRLGDPADLHDAGAADP